MDSKMDDNFFYNEGFNNEGFSLLQSEKEHMNLKRTVNVITEFAYISTKPFDINNCIFCIFSSGFPICKA